MNQSISTIKMPIIIMLTSFLVEYGLGVLLARYLGVANYGDYAITIYILKIAAILVILGGSVSITRFMPIYFTNKHWGRAKGYLGFYTSVGAIMSVVIVALFLLIDRLGWLRLEHTLFSVLWLVILFCFVLFNSMLFVVLRRASLASITNKLMLPLALLIFLLIFTFFSSVVSLRNVFIIIGIILLLIIVFQVVLLARMLPREIFSAKSEYQIYDWNKTSFRLLASSLIFTAANQIDLLMLEILSPHESHVGIFAAILIIATSIWLIRSASLLVYNPNISPFIEKHDWQGLQSLARNTAKKVTLITVCITIIVIVFSKFLLGFFGQNFSTYYASLIIVALGFSFKPVFLLADSIIKFSGAAHKNLLPQFCCFVLSIVLDILLIPHFYVLGAAVSLLISRVSLALWQALIVKRLYGVDTLMSFRFS